MTIRVSTNSEGGVTLVKVDGWFKTQDVEEFVRLLNQVNGKPALDLSELQSADRSAVEVLRELIASGVSLRKVSPYIELLLKT
jgi:hypothetical protein